MSCEECAICVEQPPDWEHTSIDGVFIKQMYLKTSGSVVPQHAHVYDHTSMLARGRIKMWAGDEYIGEYAAPTPIFIKAKVKHTFQTLEPDTLIYCIHNVGKGEVQVHEMHQLPNNLFRLT